MGIRGIQMQPKTILINRLMHIRCYQQLFVKLVFCSTVMVGSVSVSQDHDPKLRDQLEMRDQAIIRANAKEMPARIKTIKQFLELRTASREELLKRVDGESNSIAAQAAWELIWRSIPENDKDDPVNNNDKQEKDQNSKDEKWKSIDRMQVAKFMGFLEGRLRTRMPDWWENVFMETRYKRISDGQYRLFMGYVRDVKASPFHITDPCYVVPKDIKLTYEDKVLSMNRGDVTIPIPQTVTSEVQEYMPEFAFSDDGLADDEPVEDENDRGDPAVLDQDVYGLKYEPVFNFAALIETDRYFVGFPGMFSTPFTIWCISRETNEVLWRRQTLGGIHSSPGGGAVVHFVSFKVDDDRLFVFGSDHQTIYAEAYSIKDGSTLFQFTNLTRFDASRLPDEE